MGTSLREGKLWISNCWEGNRKSSPGSYSNSHNKEKGDQDSTDSVSFQDIALNKIWNNRGLGLIF